MDRGRYCASGGTAGDAGKASGCARIHGRSAGNGREAGRRRRFPSLYADGPVRPQAHGNKAEEGVDGIGKKGYHVHGQDGMDLAAGGAFQTQDLHPSFPGQAFFRIPQDQFPFICGMSAHRVHFRIAGGIRHS